MNFFKRQDEARRYTALLLFYLLAAVVLIVVAVNLIVYVAMSAGNAGPLPFSEWMRQPWWMLVTCGVILVILGGGLARYLKLKGGGHAVAQLMGARPVDAAGDDALERRLVNVVEEMSIASGTPVPDLYVMDEEPGINAFVAGYKPTQAVMVVTRGALEQLNRDELQGVVAHEFSHVLNGDMRINVRLIAILAGVLALGVVGRVMMRSLSRGSMRRSSSGRRGAQAQLIAFVLGLALFMVGYIGLFFGRLIKAAVSRQREYLADASSVQFTRNPRGIAGALWKIKSHAQGSLLQSSRAEETSHMCFGQNMRFSFSRLMATHPPVDERIRRVDPYFELERAARQQAAPAAPAPITAADGVASGFYEVVTEHAIATGPNALAASVGNPTPEHVDYAAALHQSIPQILMDAVHSPERAPLVVYGLLLGEVAAKRANVASALIRHETRLHDDDGFGLLCEAIVTLDVRFRLPLLDLAAPALRKLSRAERQEVLRIADKLVQIDRKVTLFEFVLLTLLKKQLCSRPTSNEGRYRSFAPVLPQIRILLTLMARTGTRNAREAEDAFTRAMRSFTRISLPAADEAYCQLEAMEAVLGKLSALSPLLKSSLLAACADCVLHDGKVTPAEAELLRAVSESLDCPMPPLIGITGQRVGAAA